MIPILHLDLSEAADNVATDGETLIVFWWKDVPLGQVYWLGPYDPEAALAKAVDPAILARAPERAGSQPAASGRRVAVVICTRDRPHDLKRCLASLPHQTLRPHEIIVVDNASADDRTEAVARRAGAIYVREDRAGLDIARNAGMRAATGDIVAFTDDDVVLHERWLERLESAFDDPRVLAATGLVLPAELRTESQVHFEKFWGFGRGYVRRDFGREYLVEHRRGGAPVWTIGAGASMAARRRAFGEADLFDERLDAGAAGCSGDSEFWHEVLARGGVCRYEPGAVAFHYHRTTMDGLARQIRAYMRGHAAALLVQFEQTREWGNLRRAFFLTPRHYVKRFLRQWWGSLQREEDRFLREEAVGFAAGIVYYFKTPRAKGRRRGL